MQPQREADVPITMYDLARQNEQNHHNPAESMEATPVVEISGITGYRLLGLLLAFAGLVKTALSVKGLSTPLKKMDLIVTGVFSIIYLCLGWAESSTRQFWRPFFRVDFLPIMIRGAGIVCRHAVKLAYFLFALIHACLYMTLLIWPTYLPLLMLCHAFGLMYNRLVLIGIGIFSLFVGPPLLSITSITILNWSRRFPWCERCIDHIKRYLVFSLEPLSDPGAYSTGFTLGALLMLVLIAPYLYFVLNEQLQQYP